MPLVNLAHVDLLQFTTTLWRRPERNASIHCSTVNKYRNLSALLGASGVGQCRSILQSPCIIRHQGYHHIPEHWSTRPKLSPSRFAKSLGEARMRSAKLGCVARRREDPIASRYVTSRSDFALRILASRYAS